MKRQHLWSCPLMLLWKAPERRDSGGAIAQQVATVASKMMVRY